MSASVQLNPTHEYRKYWVAHSSGTLPTPRDKADSAKSKHLFFSQLFICAKFEILPLLLPVNNDHNQAECFVCLQSCYGDNFGPISTSYQYRHKILRTTVFPLFHCSASYCDLVTSTGTHFKIRKCHLGRESPHLGNSSDITWLTDTGQIIRLSGKPCHDSSKNCR